MTPSRPGADTEPVDLTAHDQGSGAGGHQAERVGAAGPFSELDSPIFILGCAWRCGSTLLQRLLCTVDGLVIWGENQGVAALLLEASRRLEARSDVSEREREAFRGGAAAWIANMSPPVTKMDHLAGQWLTGFYVPATLELGFRRWGFKEVKHDAEIARYLLHLFPGGRIIFLMRNPVDVLASMRSRSWYQRHAGGARGVIKLWCHNARSFLKTDVPHLLVRYEDLVGDPSDSIARLEAFLDLKPGSIDRDVLQIKIRGTQTTSPTLGLQELVALRKRRVAELARSFGYAAPDPLYTSLWRLVRTTIRKPFTPGGSRAGQDPQADSESGMLQANG